MRLIHCVSRESVREIMRSTLDKRERPVKDEIYFKSHVLNLPEGGNQIVGMYSQQPRFVAISTLVTTHSC